MIYVVNLHLDIVFSFATEKKNFKGVWVEPQRRRKKDPNAPKRPMSAFLKYSQTRRRAVKAENPDMLNTDISRLLGEMWRNATEEEKCPFVEQELIERAQYKEKMSAYKNSKRRNDAESRVSHHDITPQHRMQPFLREYRPRYPEPYPAVPRPRQVGPPHTEYYRGYYPPTHVFNGFHPVIPHPPPPPPEAFQNSKAHDGIHKVDDITESSPSQPFASWEDEELPIPPPPEDDDVDHGQIFQDPVEPRHDVVQTFPFSAHPNEGKLVTIRIQIALIPPDSCDAPLLLVDNMVSTYMQGVRISADGSPQHPSNQHKDYPTTSKYFHSNHHHGSYSHAHRF